MGNCKQYVYLLFLLTITFTSCTKENIAVSSENNNQQTANSNASAVSQSLYFNDITINPSGNHVFSIPDITQSVIDKGSLTVYSTDNSTETAQWKVVSSCESGIGISSITVGKVEIQNNINTPVFMSFRFDIAAN